MMSDNSERDGASASDRSEAVSDTSPLEIEPRNLKERLAIARSEREKVLRSKGKKTNKPVVQRPMQFPQAGMLGEGLEQDARIEKVEQSKITQSSDKPTGTSGGNSSKQISKVPSTRPRSVSEYSSSPSWLSKVLIWVGAVFFGLGSGFALSFGALVALGWISASDILPGRAVQEEVSLPAAPEVSALIFKPIPPSLNVATGVEWQHKLIPPAPEVISTTSKLAAASEAENAFVAGFTATPRLDVLSVENTQMSQFDFRSTGNVLSFLDPVDVISARTELDVADEGLQLVPVLPVQNAIILQTPLSDLTSPEEGSEAIEIATVLDFPLLLRSSPAKIDVGEQEFDALPELPEQSSILLQTALVSLTAPAETVAAAQLASLQDLMPVKINVPNRIDAVDPRLDLLPDLPERSRIQLQTALFDFIPPKTETASIQIASVQDSALLPSDAPMPFGVIGQGFDNLPELPERNTIQTQTVLFDLAPPAVRTDKVKLASVQDPAPLLSNAPSRFDVAGQSLDLIPELPEQSSIQLQTVLFDLVPPVAETDTVQIATLRHPAPLLSNAPIRFDVVGQSLDLLPELPEQSSIQLQTVLFEVVKPVVETDVAQVAAIQDSAPLLSNVPSRIDAGGQSFDLLPDLPEQSTIQLQTVLVNLASPDVNFASVQVASARDFVPPINSAPTLNKTVPVEVPVVSWARLGRPDVFDKGPGDLLAFAPEDVDGIKLASLLDGPPVRAILARAPIREEIDIALPAVGAPHSLSRTLAADLGLSVDAATRYRLVTFAPENVPDDALKANAELLDSTGFPVSSVNRVNFRVSKTHVRYYDKRDEEVAIALAKEVGGLARDFTTLRNRPPVGQVEVWLEGSRKAVARRSAPKPKANATQQRAALKAQLENRLVNKLRRGEHLGGIKR